MIDFTTQISAHQTYQSPLKNSIMTRCTALEDSGLDEHLERLETVLVAWTVLASKYSSWVNEYWRGTFVAVIPSS
jgi:hypothetical protein